jgi:hypothetical protein
VYLWAGLADWADRTFCGFLNHASPLYCWREEQPLQHALVGQDWGDMPHNWASAECVRYLRHMLVLEDGPNMRLLEGVTHNDSGSVFRLERTPTRFARVSVNLEPLDGNQGWKLDFNIEPGSEPEKIFIPSLVMSRKLRRIDGARFATSNRGIAVDPHARRWTAIWR